jgi:hypothetical protein
MLWPDLEYYEGEVKDNMRHGLGLMKTCDGMSHYGHWKKGLKNGNV